MIRKWLCGPVGFLLITGAVAAQDVSVPDLTGLNVPQAAALLNRAGLKLGAENAAGWTPESGVPQNTIGGQSIPAGCGGQRGRPLAVPG